MKTLQELIVHLEKLGTGVTQPQSNEFGICYELKKESAVFVAYAYNITLSWPKYSGNAGYPVPHDSLTARDAFNQCWNLWDDSSYSDDRRELCLYLADELGKRHL